MYFNKPYNRQEFLTVFQTKICPNFVKQERPLQVNRKTAYFVDNNVYRLGTVELDQEISVLEIQQKSSKDPRITLTKDAFKILDDNGIDNALVIFYSPDNTSYRLSLLTTKYADWDNKKTSSYKRYSYILGPGEKTKTPEKQLLNPIKDYDDLISRFDVEVVRKDFFEKYLELFVRLYKDIKKDNDFTDLLLSQKVDIVSFTKNLLGKIVFLYFIQQKGWLGLGHKEKEYGKGHKNFMRVMRDNFKNSGESMSTEKTGYFYNDYLERLFFAGLNSDRRDNDDRFPNLQMKVPYLNGGLFKEDYQGREGYVTKISNDIFSNVDSKGDDADGILDIFDRYNFTVDEDSLYDSDIAVDPEMLGRIFEKMISISNDNIGEVVELYDNKGKKAKIDFGKELNKKLGAFYTPREIVHYMTKESLIAYLVNNIKGDKEENEDLIRDLFELKEQFLLHQEDLKKVGFGENTLDNLSEIIDQIDEALKKVKILDPAVGSGAFPMGLLHEISSIRYYMYGVFHSVFGDKTKEYKNNENKISMYQIKREIILNNIYGVDIDPGAIDIARLRFWLSLVVDEDQPEPLPNFEFKFVCANTLIPLEEEAKEKDLFAQGDEPKLETLKKYKREYYNASGNKEKRELKERIRDYTKIDGTLFSEPTPRAKQMAEFGANFDNSKHSHSFFDPSLMMSEWRGFDVVIGNPPYVKNTKINKKEKDHLIKLYFSLYDQWDIYIAFFEKGLNLLNLNGVSILITPNQWLSAKYGTKLRELLSNKIINLIDFRLYSDFTNASVNTFLTLYRKTKTNENPSIIIFNSDGISKVTTINRLDFIKGSNNLGKFLSKNNEIINKINDFCESKFENFYKVGHSFSIPDFYKLSEIIYEDSNCNKDELKLVSTGTLSLGGSDYGKKSFKYDGKNFNFPVVKKTDFINMFPTRKTQIGPKLIISSMGGLKIDIDLLGEYLGTRPTMWLTANNNEQLKTAFALLNSKLINWYYNEQFSVAGMTGFKIRYGNIKETPIPKISPEKQKPFIEKVDQIIAITSRTGYDPKNPPKEQLDLEREIDQMVYELYGLTEDEIKVVEKSIK